MPLIDCRECQKEVSTDAKSCPHCGAVLKSFFSRNKFWLVPVLVLVTVWIGGTLFTMNRMMKKFNNPTFNNAPIQRPEFGN